MWPMKDEQEKIAYFVRETCSEGVCSQIRVTIHCGTIPMIHLERTLQLSDKNTVYL